VRFPGSRRRRRGCSSFFRGALLWFRFRHPAGDDPLVRDILRDVDGLAGTVDGGVVDDLVGRRVARSVPVPAFVLDALSVQCRSKTPGELVFGDGGYLPRPKSSNGWFTRAVKSAGVQAITPHDLRHTCASLAVSAGVNVLALARMLGHKDPSVTLRVYADLFDTDLDAVAATLHASYSPQNVLNLCSRDAHDSSSASLKPPLPARTPGQGQCGRRDSNPQALSSAGT